jgi:hypothetical protein
MIMGLVILFVLVLQLLVQYLLVPFLLVKILAVFGVSISFFIAVGVMFLVYFVVSLLKP